MPKYDCIYIHKQSDTCMWTHACGRIYIYIYIYIYTYIHVCIHTYTYTYTHTHTHIYIYTHIGMWRMFQRELVLQQTMPLWHEFRESHLSPLGGKCIYVYMYIYIYIYMLIECVCMFFECIRVLRYV